MKNVLLRKIFQSIIFVIFIYIIWTTREPLSAFINPKLIFQIDPLVMIVTSIAERIMITGLIFAVVTLLVTFIFGRVFCGWFCPLGAVMDFWAYITNVLFRRKEHHLFHFRKIKYYILAALFGAGILGFQLVWFWDPLTIFVRTFSFNLHPFVNVSLDKIFIGFIKFANYPDSLERIYQVIKESFLEIKNPVFPHTYHILIVFVLILILVLIRRRFWCRYICPLGALLAVPSGVSLLERVSGKCAKGCSVCKNICRMNAINTDNSYIKSECIVCMDCVELCPGNNSVFLFRKTGIPAQNIPSARNGLSRFDFLIWFSGLMVALIGFKKGLLANNKTPLKVRPVVRPPGSLKEEEFVNRCVRCGNCMKVCITNVLQPSVFESGFSGVWTPYLNMNLGYCEYKCSLCTKVCPTGAIKPLNETEKMSAKLGIAYINRNVCLPWALGEECIVCQEHCPVGSKAIKVEKTKNKFGQDLLLPYVDADTCVGCGICQNKCPVRPVRAITVIS